MQEITIYAKICSGCGGTGVMPSGVLGDTIPCTMCGGTMKQKIGSMEIDIPTTSQFSNKFQVLEDGLQAIWNKVKDL